MKKVDAESLREPPKFQVNIKIQLNTDYLPVSYDYDESQVFERCDCTIIVHNDLYYELVI